METIVLLLFMVGLIICVISGIPVVAALLWGAVLFGFYAWKQGFSPRQVLQMFCEGAKRISNVMLVFVCIGCLTAVWRICGTIPYIVYHAAGMIMPKYFILCAFILCSIISIMTGSCFSTASTLGTICMMLGHATGVPSVPLAGAILSGCLFGDRWSPMSTSAHLIATMTHTDIYGNLKRMFRTCLIPLSATLLIYFWMGSDSGVSDSHVLAVFEHSFQLTWPCLIPAVLMLAMCMFKLDVKLVMVSSTLAGILLAIFVQKASLSTLLISMVMGYQPIGDPELSALLAGGGLRSMLNVASIVFISSCFSGVFEKTALLNGVGQAIVHLAKRTTREIAFLITAIVTSMVACNQTLASLLTEQLFRPIVPEGEQRADFLEDTTIMISPMIPWNIACAAPLAILGVGGEAVPYACYLYLIPLWFIIRSSFAKHKSSVR